MATLFVASAISMKAVNEPIETGSYTSDWQSLSAWECPEWFKDAKFGIWAHWGPQCEAHGGDWYARGMYYAGSGQYNWHVNRYGNPATFGFKDVINEWGAEKWNPEALVTLYKSVGARYFFTLGQHHDNFDLWNSPYQEWNSVNMGPKRNIVKEWDDACKKNGLPMGISMHGSHTWTWFEIAQLYDGNLTKADGVGKWWEGYDPQELYAQNHQPSSGYQSSGTIHSQWDWGSGASLPSEAYKQKFQNRVIECINTFNPAMLYFDDSVLPFYGCDNQIGLDIVSHYYNHDANNNGNGVVVMGKKLQANHKESMLWDVERGIPDRPQEDYWQTCTCIGSWHYDDNVYKNGSYKSAQQVISMLVDIVSKNGNLLLSVPLRGDGALDEKEMVILDGIKAWMDVNSISIYGTRPWINFGEGPLAEASNPLTSQGFNENNNYSSKDVRYVERNDTVYATIMRWPAANSLFTFESFGYASAFYPGKVEKVTLLGYGSIDFTQDINGLSITLPATKSNAIAPVFEISIDEEDSASLSLAQFIAIYEGIIAQMRTQVGYNTGKLSRTKVNDFAQYVEACKADTSADEATQKAIIQALNETYQEFLKDGYNVGGLPNEEGSENVTVEYLKEASNFARTAQTNNGLRFGAPLNWTVENFNIPQTNSDGTKQGLDKYSGSNALMLGVWNDRDANTVGDVSNARIYQKRHLKAGRYYFGASYHANYQLNNAYIFAADSVLNTRDIPEKSIAYAPINQATISTDFYGIYFTLNEAADVVLGFQVDLTESNTQEFRAQAVKLLYYGEINFTAIDALIANANNLISTSVINSNTGFYSQDAVATLQTALDVALEMDENATYETLNDAYNQLNLAIKNFKESGKNPGGAPNAADHEDLTVPKLVESANFSRLDPSITTRFATPRYWTVENFKIPNGTAGTKNGIDKHPGYDCLSIGIWNDAASNQEGDISNARLYRTVRLKAGRYYFGASYNTTYSLSDKAYLFASSELVQTKDIPSASIAYYPINKAPDNNDASWHGLFFNIPEEMDVTLGFQVDLKNGSGTQEFRAKGVKLLYYGEITFDKLQADIAAIEDTLLTIKVNENTGYYNEVACDSLRAVIERVKAIGNADYDAINKAYQLLSDAYSTFIKEGKNVGGQPAAVGSKDITINLLKESSEFARTAESGTARYGAPQHWTVENFRIDNGSDGIKQGLDKYSGFDCLMLGVWDDKTFSSGGDLTNARIYQKVFLEAGKYYFGANFNTLYNLNAAYIFASDGLINTSEMETNSIAYLSIMACKSDDKFYGIFFTLDKPQEVVLGFQADLQGGAMRQEFRASSLKLLQYGVTAIDHPRNEVILFTGTPRYYSLTGVELPRPPQKGLFIMKIGDKALKVFIR